MTAARAVDLAQQKRCDGPADTRFGANKNSPSQSSSQTGKTPAPQASRTPPAGFEPATIGLEVRRSVH
jgi:hypothetical protein